MDMRQAECLVQKLNPEDHNQRFAKNTGESFRG